MAGDELNSTPYLSAPENAGPGRLPAAGEEKTRQGQLAGQQRQNPGPRLGRTGESLTLPGAAVTRAL